MVERLSVSDGAHAELTDCGAGYHVNLFSEYDGILQLLEVADDSTLDADLLVGEVGDISFDDRLSVGTSLLVAGLIALLLGVVFEWRARQRAGEGR